MCQNTKEPHRKEKNHQEYNIEDPDNDVFVMAQEEPFKWYLCSFKCMNIEALEWHKKITNGYMCPHCKFRFKDNEKLKNQITLSHNHMKTASMIYLTNNFLSSQVKRYKQISCQWDFTGRRFLSRR